MHNEAHKLHGECSRRRYLTTEFNPGGNAGNSTSPSLKNVLENKKTAPRSYETGRRFDLRQLDYFAWETATATATEAPTIGLLPMPMRPIISTCAGTLEEPANCASPCMRPIVSVMP